MPNAKVMNSACSAEPASSPYQSSASMFARGEKTGAMPSMNFVAGAGVWSMVHCL